MTRYIEISSPLVSCFTETVMMREQGLQYAELIKLYKSEQVWACIVINLGGLRQNSLVQLRIEYIKMVAIAFSCFQLEKDGDGYIVENVEFKYLFISIVIMVVIQAKLTCITRRIDMRTSLQLQSKITHDMDLLSLMQGGVQKFVELSHEELGILITNLYEIESMVRIDLCSHLPHISFEPK